MLIGWPGRQPLEDWQLILLLVVIGFAVTAFIFRLARRRAARDARRDQD